ncbi:MAG TPA: hypothetical protein DCE41_37705 [Cytophagales bacterium]|nr:hypothetical protein [Cytophagales bacterium]HAA22358.1 hypothetical protein [Cytophagales bacterium]HAP62181.1 hypothetical protein [Cytophagales bacterium]
MPSTCTHTFKRSDAPSSIQGQCIIQEIFDLHTEVCGAEYPPLPHDEDGECIFHSTHEAWKREYEGGLWAVRLFSALQDLNGLFPEHGRVANLFPDGHVDLREITWIGMPVSELHNVTGQPIGATLDLSGFCLDHLKVWLVNSKWLDRVTSQKGEWHTLYWANSHFFEEVNFSESQFYSLGFHGCTFEDTCEISASFHTSFMTFSHCVVKGDFHLNDNEFEAEVSLNYSRFEGFDMAEIGSVFKKYVDFTASQFYTMAKITFCTFEQEVTFLDTVFHRRAFFQGNTFKRSAVFKREKAEAPLFQEVIDF